MKELSDGLTIGLGKEELVVVALFCDSLYRTPTALRSVLTGRSSSRNSTLPTQGTNERETISSFPFLSLRHHAASKSVSSSPTAQSAATKGGKGFHACVNDDGGGGERLLLSPPPPLTPPRSESTWLPPSPCKTLFGDGGGGGGRRLRRKGYGRTDGRSGRRRRRRHKKNCTALSSLFPLPLGLLPPPPLSPSPPPSQISPPLSSLSDGGGGGGGEKEELGSRELGAAIAGASSDSDSLGLFIRTWACFSFCEPTVHRLSLFPFAPVGGGD